MADPSDLARLLTWWSGLADQTFVALSPPRPRGRYTQSDLHDDAVEAISAADLPRTTAYAGWHWQSHERAFDRSGGLIDPLLLHWGGDPQVVHAHLTTVPDGFLVSAPQPGAAFSLDRVVRLGPDGLADPGDPASVRQELARLTSPIDAHATAFAELTTAEEAWLLDRWEQSPDLDRAAGFVRALALRDRIDADRLAGLAAAWLDLPRPEAWPAWKAMLATLVRQSHPAASVVVGRLGALADSVLADVPTPAAVAVLREHALAAGAGPDLTPWLRAHRAVHGGDRVTAALALWDDLAALGSGESRAAALAQALTRVTPAPFAALAVATDDRLPLAVRRGAAQAARESLPHAEEQGSPLAEQFRGCSDLLLEGSGPDLSATESRLSLHLDDFRDLSPAQEAWLHARVADPALDLQGLAFCLEILVAHGRGTAADIEALSAGWKKRIAINYRTTYCAWRHPLVTLTVLARDLGHPLRDELAAHLARTTPKWLAGLAPLTLAGNSSPDDARALWDAAVAEENASQLWRTWLLAQHRLTGRPVVELGATILHEASPRYPGQVANAVMATVVPSAPLWTYAFSARDVAWLDRGLLVLETPRLAPQLRELVVREVSRHSFLEHPDQVLPRPTEAQLADLRGRWHQVMQPR
ncbi:hypothetical protein ACSDQ9_12360 [Aestuariimicrobium soli]|uniref:hypothetical protein n=1 Tax=Aestuariimicrobium soli TaxID=2035834 RepID=UPI003EBC7A1B